jgi:ABC-2 type transport system ATP-binding protein
MAVIKIDNLKKHFGTTKALDGVTLSVEQGDIFGFIGPNGAGKTTTIRILLGILRKTSGDVSLLNKDPFADAVEIHKRTAYVPGGCVPVAESGRRRDYRPAGAAPRRYT